MTQARLTDYGLTKMCRLCLTCDGVMSDIFLFSSQLGENIHDVIMKCAPVKISANDGLPHFICQLCHAQLKNANNFQLQIVRSERTMRRYLQNSKTSDKSSKLESPEHVANGNFDADTTVKNEPLELITVKNEPLELITVKSEPLELKDAYFDENSDKETTFNEMSVEMPLTCEIIPLNDRPTGSRIKAFYTDETPFPVYESETNIDYENIKVNIGAPEGAAETSDNIDCSDEMDCSERIDMKKNIPGKREISKKITKYKPFQCNVCDKSFTQLHSLKSHKLVHTGEKPYRCDVCDKSFTQLGNLKVHNRMHTGEKPFKCDMCEKCYARSSYLIIHKRTHSHKDAKK